jgi:hypothetical protein
MVARQVEQTMLRRSIWSCAVLVAACTNDAEPEQVVWHEPTTLAGGCIGGKPDQGGVSFKASRRGGELILEVHQDEWIDDAPPVITSSPLTSEQWRELVELARVDDLWNWRPSSRAHADCQTCQVSLDDHVARFCGTLDGPDRGAALRRRLESLAVASGWTR